MVSRVNAFLFAGMNPLKTWNLAGVALLSPGRKHAQAGDARLPSLTPCVTDVPSAVPVPTIGVAIPDLSLSSPLAGSLIGRDFGRMERESRGERQPERSDQPKESTYPPWLEGLETFSGGRKVSSATYFSTKFVTKEWHTTLGCHKTCG
jgi:hypothetical protein